MNSSVSIDFSFNRSNNSINFCSIPHTSKSLSEFLICYYYFYSLDTKQSYLELGLALITVILNLLVCISIKSNSDKLNVFDKILIGHAFVDGFTGFIDIPFYHISVFFGYWPFGNILSLIWASYDNNINTTTNLHMFYMSWTRLRSILAPKTYQNEYLIKKPKMVMLGIWIFSLTIWTSVTVSFGMIEYTISVNYQPGYSIVILNVLLWFIPLMLIFVTSTWILYELRTRDKKRVKKKKSSTNAMSKQNSINFSNDNQNKQPILNNILKRLKKFRLKSQTKFSIIIWSYWIQWTIPCLAIVINRFCNCISDSILKSIYWLTYTVCAVDPLIVLVLNPNVSCFRKKK